MILLFFIASAFSLTCPAGYSLLPFSLDDLLLPTSNLYPLCTVISTKNFQYKQTNACASYISKSNTSASIQCPPNSICQFQLPIDKTQNDEYLFYSSFTANNVPEISVGLQVDSAYTSGSWATFKRYIRPSGTYNYTFKLGSTNLASSNPIRFIAIEIRNHESNNIAKVSFNLLHLCGGTIYMSLISREPQNYELSSDKITAVSGAVILPALARESSNMTFGNVETSRLYVLSVIDLVPESTIEFSFKSSGNTYYNLTGQVSLSRDKILLDARFDMSENIIFTSRCNMPLTADGWCPFSVQVFCGLPNAPFYIKLTGKGMVAIRNLNVFG